MRDKRSPPALLAKPCWACEEPIEGRSCRDSSATDCGGPREPTRLRRERSAGRGRKEGGVANRLPCPREEALRCLLFPCP